jgi:large subunit ribosomal protein L3
MGIQGLLGRKVGMTTHYKEDGTVQAVTAIETGPCVITQVRTLARDGYEAVQVGFQDARRLNKPLSGHQRRSGGKFRHLQEFQVSDLSDHEVGQRLTAEIFEPGEEINVIGASRGRGFAGGMRRYNFRGGPKTHGQSDRHRAPGSIGAGTSPGRVWKGTRMAGHMGNARVTQKGLEVVLADPERNLLLVKAPFRERPTRSSA